MGNFPGLRPIFSIPAFQGGFLQAELTTWRMNCGAASDLLAIACCQYLKDL